MASLPYPLDRLYTHIVSVIATTQSACILMSVWVWQGCHTLLQIPILLFLKNLFFCSSVFSKTTCSHVLLSFPNNMFSCSSVFSNKNMFSCPHVFPQKHVLMFFCLFKQKHVLMSFPKNMFSCSSVFSKTTCSSVFPPKTTCSPSTHVFMSPKKTAGSNAPSR